MKNFPTKLWILLACVLGSAQAYGVCTAYYCSDVYIETLYPNNITSGLTYIDTTGDESLMTNCTPVSGRYFTMNMNTDGAKAVYSTLLSAFMADKKVQIVAVSGSSTCEVAYVTLDRQ